MRAPSQSSLSIPFEFSADVSPELANIQAYVDGSKSQSDISKVAVRDKSAKLQSRLKVAGHPSDADSKQQKETDNVVYILTFHRAPTACR